MRLGVLDVGSNTVKLQVVDGYPGAPPLPTYAHKVRARLAEAIHDNRVSAEGVRRLEDAVEAAVDVADAQDVDELIPFATEALRNADNGEEICGRIAALTGVALQPMSGQDEARLIYLAAHRWHGWSARQLLVLDIGGGSLEIAHGRDEQPQLAVSLPLGASRLTGEFLSGDQTDPGELDELQRHARTTIRQVADRLRWEGEPAVVVATSKTFKQLARITGAPRQREGPFVRRSLRRRDLGRWAARLAKMPVGERAGVRGVSRSRGEQILAGAVVAEAAMKVLDIERLDICPWALREGILLRRIDRLYDAAAARDDAMIAGAAQDRTDGRHHATRLEPRLAHR